MDKPEYYECECTDFDHIMRVRYFDNVSPDDPDFLYVETHLRIAPLVEFDYWLVFNRFNIPIIKFPRPWTALKHLFGFRSKYGDFDEYLWTPEKAKRFAEHCMRYYNAATVEEDKKE